QVEEGLDCLLGQSLRPAPCAMGLLSCQALRASSDHLRRQAVLSGVTWTMNRTVASLAFAVLTALALWAQAGTPAAGGRRAAGRPPADLQRWRWPYRPRHRLPRKMAARLLWVFALRRPVPHWAQRARQCARADRPGG